MNIEIPPFYVGQEVVAVRNFNDAKIKKGDEFRVTSITKSECKCCEWDVTVGIKSPRPGRYTCHKCWTPISFGVEWPFGAQIFAPKHQLGEMVSMNEFLKEQLEKELVSQN